MKADRLVGIIFLLLERGRVSARELAESFEVSPRTIYRDIDAIGMAGIPIRAVSGVGGGFEIMPGYTLDKNVFTEDELSALMMGLSGLFSITRGQELKNALTKLKSLVPSERVQELEVRANQICIDLRPWLGRRNTQAYLDLIKAAMQERRLLSFQYIDRHGNESARIAEPYQLVLKGGAWYFQGYCLSRNDFRLFRLSRMASPEMRKESFIPRAYQRPILDIPENVAPAQLEITLRIHRAIIDRVLEVCEYDALTPDGDEHFIVRLPFIDRDYYYDQLLSLGDKCQCLAPLYVRDKLRGKIRALAAAYGD